MIVMLFTNIELVNAGLVTNVKGATIAVGYGAVAVFLILSVIIALLNLKKMDTRYLPIFLVLAIMGVLYTFTLMFPGMIIYDLVLALMCYVMYFTIENPDLKMQKELDYQKEQVENSKNISNKVINTISDNLNEYVERISKFGHKKFNYNDIEDVKKEVTNMQKFALEYINNVNSLLDLSKTQSEGFTLEELNYEPSQMMNEVKDFLSAKNKNIKVDIISNQNIPPVLYGDKKKIKQVLLHLYNGIIHISKQKNIEFNTIYQVVGSLCRFKVSTKIDINDLVNEYTKDLKNKVIDFEIIERILKLLEGKFTMVLEENIVKIEISIDQKYMEGYYVKEEIKSTTNKKINYVDLTGKNVLIIDDDKDRADEIMHMLSNYNIESSIAVDYNSTKKEVSEKVFDLVIIDDIISELDRVKNYLLIDKTNGLLKVMDHIEYDVPRIIMVTPNTKDYETKYIEEGFDETLTKPVDKYKLDSIINLVKQTLEQASNL